jgi:hypothetical protein
VPNALIDRERGEGSGCQDVDRDRFVGLGFPEGDMFVRGQMKDNRRPGLRHDPADLQRVSHVREAKVQFSCSRHVAAQPKE